MAAKKKFPQWQVDLLGLGLSFVGGGLSSIAMTQADLRIKQFEDMPALSPLANGLIGGILIFVLPPAVKPLGYGMTAMSGGSTADMALNGLSRIEIQGDEIQGRIEDAEEIVDSLTEENEAIQAAADEAQDVEYEISESDGTE